MASPSGGDGRLCGTAATKPVATFQGSCSGKLWDIETLLRWEAHVGPGIYMQK